MILTILSRLTLSEITLSSQEIKNWLDNETNDFLLPIQLEAKKNQENLQEILENIRQVSKSLLDISLNEIEKRNMRVLNRARVLNKLATLFLERIERIKICDQVSYVNLSKEVMETSKIFRVTDIDIKNFFPRISPFFVRDRRKFLAVYEKAKESFEKINEFIKEEYVKTKILQETFQIISELVDLEKKINEIEVELISIKKDQLSSAKELDEFTIKIASLEDKDTLNQLSQIDQEIIKLRIEANKAFRHLKKPFKKMQALSLRYNSTNLNPKEIAILDLYIENPFDALIAEKEGYPLLKQILTILKDLLDSGKLKLKSDKTRKAQIALKNTIQNSLAKLHRQSVEINKQKKLILTSDTLTEITKKQAEFQEQTRKLEARKARIDAYALVKKTKSNRILDKINQHKKQIENNVYKSIEKKIKIE